MRAITLVLLLVLCPTALSGAPATLRIASFNIAMGLEHEGDLGRALASGDDPRLRQVAEILQRVRPDIVLLNEFDYDPSSDAAALFNDHYLGRGQRGQAPIQYPHHFRGPVNTGVDSGLDLDGDGATGGPGDAWGFGRFPGQYGMLVLSRFPIDHGASRTFEDYLWADLPGALQPRHPDGREFYPPETWAQLKLSSKSHWDLAIDTPGRRLHLLAHHPTPPVFDGPEDRNGRRNFDEIRFWLNYTRKQRPDSFVIAGDFNADPNDGDSLENAIGQLLQADWIDDRCLPTSSGAAEAARLQGGANEMQRGNPAADTADFDDRRTGNLRLDYVLPSADLRVTGCGVFWPARGEDGHELIGVSDHRLVWLDLLP
jgi:endonuclease/exonuclease/phosphatase family metal-dependent hydrolase